MKKTNLLALPLSLLFLLGACSEDEKTENAKKIPSSAESEAATGTVAVAPAPETDLELPAADDIVVVVDGEEIKGTVYNSVARQLEISLLTQGKKVTDPQIAEQVKEQVIDIIVSNKLIIQDAVKKGHAADTELLEQRLEALKNQYESEEQLTAALQRTGFTLEDMEQQLRDQLIYESYLAAEVEDIKVTEADLEEAYQSYVDSSEGETPAFEEMKPMILQSLEEQNEQQAVYNRIEKLRKAAQIDVKI